MFNLPLIKIYNRVFIPQCRLIVSQMSDTRCEAFNGLLIPYALVMCTVFMFPVSATTELLLLAGLCVASSIAHIYYGTKVVSFMFSLFPSVDYLLPFWCLRRSIRIKY